MGHTGGLVSAPCVSGLSQRGHFSPPFLRHDPKTVHAVTQLSPPGDTHSHRESTAGLVGVLGSWACGRVWVSWEGGACGHVWVCSSLFVCFLVMSLSAILP